MGKVADAFRQSEFAESFGILKIVREWEAPKGGVIAFEGEQEANHGFFIFICDDEAWQSFGDGADDDSFALTLRAITLVAHLGGFERVDTSDYRIGNNPTSLSVHGDD